MDWTAVGLTLKLATSTMLILLVLGVPIAYWLVTTRWKGKFLIEAVVALPIILPPTVLGFYILMATGPRSPLGQAYDDLTGHLLPFSFPGILLGSVLYNLPFAVRPFVAAFSSVNQRLVEASWSLGVSKLSTFFRTTVPLAKSGILAGMVLTFAHSVGEFGVVLMVGGNIPGVTRTISIAIYDNVQALNYEAASLTALCLLAFSFLVLCVLSLLQKNKLAI